MSEFKKSGDPRTLLLNTYHAALDAINGRDRVVAALSNQPLDGAVYVVAIGKAAAAMMQGAVDVLGNQLRSCLLITKYGHMDETLFHHIRLHVIEAGHPLPDEKSLMAGEQLISFLERTPTTASVLFLISGGASSLVDVPVDGIGLNELRRINTWLLGSGLAIGPVNSIWPCK